MDDLISERIEKGAEILRNGGIVAYPTDTVYGLGACYDNEDAIRHVYTIKKRSLNNPLPLLLPDIALIPDYVREYTGTAQALVAAFLPGALTLVMKKSFTVPDIICGGNDTIALRVPGHSVTIRLIEETGTPIIGTSANISGKPSAHTAEEVYEQLGETVDYIVDGGKCPGGKESTIVDVTGHTPVILREGALSREVIEKVCAVKRSDKE